MSRYKLKTSLCALKLLLRLQSSGQTRQTNVSSLREVYTKRAFPKDWCYFPCKSPPPPPSSPSSPRPPITPGQILGVGLDLSRVAIPRSRRERGDGTQVGERGSQGEGHNLFGSQSKRYGRYRLLFHGGGIDEVRRDDTWLRTHFDRETLYREQ